MKKEPGEMIMRGMNTKIFFALLFLFQLLLIFQGIDLSDEGFLSTFYQQIFSNPETVQYSFMFWLTGIIGGLYLKIFGFLGLWGLRLGGVLVTTGTAMLVYNLLKKYLNPSYLKLSLFLIIIALNNDVKELNYNNLSALVFVSSIYFLFNGLKENIRWKIFLSGVFVSLNFFIRPPNILDLGLALAIIYYGYVLKRSYPVISGQVLVFLSGFLLSCVFILSLIFMLGHWPYYQNAFLVIYKMGKVNTQVTVAHSDYGLQNLVHQLESNNAKSIFYTLFVFAGLILGVYYFDRISERRTFLARFRPFLKYVLVLAVFILLLKGIIDIYSILFFYTGLILIVAVFIFSSSNGFDTKFLLACGCYMLVFYPFGSSAGILTAGRYTYWIGLPICIDYLLHIQTIKNNISFSRNRIQKALQLSLSEYQLGMIKRLLLTGLIVEGLYHSFFNPFFDYHSRLSMRYPIDNQMMAGIFVSKGRADVLNGLLRESTKYVKKGDYVLAYDCLPLYYFMTGARAYIKSPYPYLYKAEIFEAELKRARQDNKGLPVVILQTIQTIGDGSGWPEKHLTTDYAQYPANKERNKYMNEFLRQNQYKEVWTNGYFRIMLPGKEAAKALLPG